MPDSSKPAADQKEETKEKMNDWPALAEIHSLRDCAKWISIAHSGKNASLLPEILLQELKKGTLSAGFHLPADPLMWIDIPSKYWIGVTKAEFDSIRVKSDSKTKTGAFTVSLEGFLDQYIDAHLVVAGGRNVQIRLRDGVIWCRS
jgi:hypothetical protein